MNEPEYLNLWPTGTVQFLPIRRCTLGTLIHSVKCQVSSLFAKCNRTHNSCEDLNGGLCCNRRHGWRFAINFLLNAKFHRIQADIALSHPVERVVLADIISDLPTGLVDAQKHILRPTTLRVLSLLAFVGRHISALVVTYCDVEDCSTTLVKIADVLDDPHFGQLIAFSVLPFASSHYESLGGTVLLRGTDRQSTDYSFPRLLIHFLQGFAYWNEGRLM
uniref:Uncharacterized protein n=1 Tax=Solanum tuberosum TaxID=4113 RepID=M1DT51_SOLTU